MTDSKTTGSRRRFIATGLSIFVLAVLARVLVTALQDGFWTLSNEIPGVVEAHSGNASWPRLHRCELMEGVRPALNSILLRALFEFAGPSVVAIQWLGILLGSITAVSGWFGARAWYGRTEGLCVGLLLALLPGHVGSGLGFDPAHVGPTILILGWALCGVLRLAPNTRLGTVSLLLGALVAGSSIFGRFELALLLPFSALALVLLPGPSLRVRLAAGALACAPALYFLGCDGYFLAADQRFPSFYWDQLSSSAGHTGLSYPASLRAWFSYGFTPLGMVGIPLALLGSVRAGSSFSRRHLLAISGSVFLLLFLTWRSVTTSLTSQWEYAFVVLVGTTVLAGLGMAQVVRWIGRARAVAVAVLILIVLAGAAWLERTPTGPHFVRNLRPHTAETGVIYDLLVEQKLPPLPPVVIGYSTLTGEDLVLNVWLGRAPLDEVVSAFRLSRGGLLEELLDGTLPPNVYVLVTPATAQKLPPTAVDGWTVYRTGGWLVLAPEPDARGNDGEGPHP
jgi:hypothetical protein